MEYKLLSPGDSDPDNLRGKYITLRERDFMDRYKSGGYTAQPDARDLDPNTRFLLAVDKDNNVLAGLRFMFREKASPNRLHLEDIDSCRLENLLPHPYFDAASLRCAEIGGLATQETHAHLALELEKEALRRCTAQEIKADILMARVVARNNPLVIRAWEAAGLTSGVVRSDMPVLRDGIERTVMIASFDDAHTQQLQAMTAAGLGVTFAQCRAHFKHVRHGGITTDVPADPVTPTKEREV